MLWTLGWATANWAFTFRCPGAGRAPPSVAGMRRPHPFSVPVVLVALVAGCSSGRPTAGPTAGTPTAAAPTVIASTAPASTEPSAAAQSAVAAESNPPGDIPDNIAFITYTNTAGRYR